MRAVRSSASRLPRVAFRLTQNDGHPVSPVLALWLLPIPVMDCLVLIVAGSGRAAPPSLRAATTSTTTCSMPGLPQLDPGGVGNLQSALRPRGRLGERIDVPHPVLLGTFVVLCLAWYWLTSRRERALRFVRALRGGRRRPGRRGESLNQFAR